MAAFGNINAGFPGASTAPGAKTSAAVSPPGEINPPLAGAPENSEPALASCADAALDDSKQKMIAKTGPSGPAARIAEEKRMTANFSVGIAAISSRLRGLFPPQGYARGANRPFEAPMLDALQLLKTRRSVKPMELTGPPPSAAEIETLLTIASRVPDHGKLAPWRFILFEGDARAAAGAIIADVFRAGRGDATAEQIDFERGRLSRAPLVIAVVSRAAPHVKIPEWEQQLSAGAAAMNLVLAAHAMGYAASWITEWYAYDRAVLDRLGLGPQERMAGFVHIGRPAKPPEDRERPPLDAIVTRFSAPGH